MKLATNTDRAHSTFETYKTSNTPNFFAKYLPSRIVNPIQIIIAGKMTALSYSVISG